MRLRRKVGYGRPVGIGLLSWGIASLGLSASAVAQGVYGPPPAITAPGGVAGIKPVDAAAPEAGGVGQPPAWLLTPSLEIGEIYNDNVALAPKGSEVWDFITTVSPGLNLIGNTPRATLNLTYDPQELIFARGTFANTLQQRLLGTGRAELWREVLFFEASASIDQEFLRNSGPIGTTTLTTSSNLQTVEAATASPYLLQHLGQYADSETRYRFSTVTTSGDTIAPEQIHEARQRFTSGEYFGRLSWALTGDAVKVDRLKGTADPLGGTSAQDDLVRVDLKYPIYRALSAIGGAGYERISDPALIQQPRGAIWNVGLLYQPNQFASALLTYGRRFDRSDVEFDANYTPTPDLHIRGIYSLSVQTSQSQIATSLSQLSTGPNGALINSRTGLPFTGVSTGTPGTLTSAFGIASGAFLERRFELDADVTRGRNRYSAAVYDVKDSGDVAAIASERIIGGAIGWDRQLWPNLSFTAGAAYYRASFLDGSGRIDNSYNIDLGLVYTLSLKTTARLTVSRLDTESNSVANSVVNDLVMVFIRKQF